MCSRYDSVTGAPLATSLDAARGERARIAGLEPAHVDEDEDIEARTFELREAREMVRRGEIVDMKTIVGLGLI